MTRDQLETRIRSAVSRYSRSIADSSGVPLGLVEELAGVAEEYADTTRPQATETTAPRARGGTTPRRAAARQ